ncbi:MAG: hypothetical protein LBT53_08900, partial [Puniceicoccales bacterium]|nr:hypothetical protein [Puniceicoccales bacterium]
KGSFRAISIAQFFNESKAQVNFVVRLEDSDAGRASPDELEESVFEAERELAQIASASKSCANPSR